MVFQRKLVETKIRHSKVWKT